MTNSSDPDQLASSKVNWSGSTLFATTGHVVFSKYSEWGLFLTERFSERFPRIYLETWLVAKKDIKTNEIVVESLYCLSQEDSRLLQWCPTWLGSFMGQVRKYSLKKSCHWTSSVRQNGEINYVVQMNVLIPLMINLPQVFRHLNPTFQTHTDTIANSADPMRWLMMSLLIRIYTVCQLLMILSKKKNSGHDQYKDGSIHLRNSRMKKFTLYLEHSRSHTTACESRRESAMRVQNCWYLHTQNLLQILCLYTLQHLYILLESLFTH